MQRAGVKHFAVLFLLATAVYFLDGRGFLDPLKSAAQTVTLPVQYLVYSARRSGAETFSFLTFWKSGEARIKNLEQRNWELLSSENKAKVLEKENEELRKQLGVKLQSTQKLLPAPVLGLSRFLEIGVGDEDGAVIGQTVVYLDNYLGKIVRVTPRASYVQLPIDPQAKIPAKAGSGRGLISGQFNFSILLDRVSQSEEIETGDLVLTTGEGESTRPNLVIGKVGKIIDSGTDVFRRAEVTPLVDYHKLEMVFIVLE